MFFYPFFNVLILHLELNINNIFCPLLMITLTVIYLTLTYIIN